jgi:predicted RNase H-like nuclease (RuvC/YqgF family)
MGAVMQIGVSQNFLGNKPDVIDRYGPGWSVGRINTAIATELSNEDGTYLTRKAKMISTDYEKATEITETADKMFKRNISALMNTTEELQTNIKKVSGNVRKAADDLAAGLTKVEKTANFANLERYVNLLERAATAMSTLAELEKEGKLDKISSALK